MRVVRRAGPAIALALGALLLCLLPAAAAAREPVISYIQPGRFGLWDEQAEADLPSPPIPVPNSQAGADTFRYGMSLDGRYIAYLDPTKKIHLLDRATNTAVSLPGVDVNADPNFLTVSDTGLIAFDDNGNGPTRVYDSVAKVFVTTKLAPTEANNKHRQSKLSGNGRFLITTCLDAANCVSDSGGDSDPYVQDLVTKLSVLPAGADTPSDEEDPCINGDGTLVGWHHGNPVQKDVFLYDRTTSSFVTLPGLNTGGNGADKDDTFCQLDSAGAYVGFTNSAAGFRVYRRAGALFLMLPNKPFDSRSRLSDLFPPPDHVSPALAGLDLTNSTFRVGPEATPVTASKRARRGTTFRYRLSEAATVTILIERRTKGRKVGTKCRKATRRLRKHRRCTRYVAKGTLTRKNLKAGQNSTPFSGRIGTKKLRTGRYRATLTATDGAGNASKVARVSFRIVR